MQQGLSRLAGHRNRVVAALFLALLAEAYGKTGQTEEGLDVVAEALRCADKTRERFYEAELYRLKGNYAYSLGSLKSPRLS